MVDQVLKAVLCQKTNVLTRQSSDSLSICGLSVVDVLVFALTANDQIVLMGIRSKELFKGVPRSLLTFLTNNTMKKHLSQASVALVLLLGTFALVQDAFAAEELWCPPASSDACTSGVFEIHSYKTVAGVEYCCIVI